MNFLNSIKQNLSQNFNKHLSILKNPKIFQNPQNLGLKHEMHEEWEIRSLSSEETLEKAWRNLKEKIGSEMRVFGRGIEKAIEREIERNEARITRGEYIEPQ